MTSMTLCIGAALQMTNWEQFFLSSSGLAIFYASHWEEFLTNHLVLDRYANPTEAQVGMIIILLIAGTIGPGFFVIPFSYVLGNGLGILGSLTLTTCIVYSTFLGCLYSFIDNIIKVNRWTKKNNKSLFYGFSPILPAVIQIVLLDIWVFNSKVDIVKNWAVAVHILNGLLSSYICDELVVCRITKMPFPPLRPILILPLLGALNVAFTSVPIVPEVYVLAVLLLILSVTYVYLLTSIVLQLSHHLNIYVFWIPPVPSPTSK